MDKALRESSAADAADGFQRVRPATKILEISVAAPDSNQPKIVSSVLPRPFTREGALFAVRKVLGEPRSEATAS